MDMLALINSLHTVLKITNEVSYEIHHFPLHVKIKGQNKELTSNSFCHFNIIQ